MYGWTDERVATLKKLWSEGLSGGQIASRLGGVTRNAVIGKIHRLGEAHREGNGPKLRQRPQMSKRNTGLPIRPTRVQDRNKGNSHAPKLAAVEQEPVAKAPLPSVIFEADAPLMLRAHLLDLREHMCRWPIGDPQDDAFHFCGRYKASRISYCDHHARQAFQPVSRRAG